jgi:triosephosphate isomerase (TIM)
MRRYLIAGNWKMNLDRAAGVRLAAGVAEVARERTQLDVAVCPPFVYLEAVAGALAGSPVALGAQDMYHQPSGAFTGEVSAAMLLDVGCRYVILGHSERRHILGETDQDVNRKVHAALAAGLTPIVCVGEKLDQREAGQTGEVVRRQFDGSLAGLTPEHVARVVIAYEPVWAIGTGKTATPDQAEEVQADLRTIVAQRYNDELAATVRILYGGSVTAANAADLLAQPSVDGVLVGGASLKLEEFSGIIAAGASRSTG